MTAIVVRPPRRLAPRLLWLVPGIAIGLYANITAGQHGLGLVPILVFGIAPHLAVVAGIGQPHAPGQLAARAVPLFNAMHQPLLPLVLVAVAAAGVISPFWFVGGLAWLGHIVADQGFGNGLRTADGWRRPAWLAR